MIFSSIFFSHSLSYLTASIFKALSLLCPASNARTLSLPTVSLDRVQYVNAVAHLLTHASSQMSIESCANIVATSRAPFSCPFPCPRRLPRHIARMCKQINKYL